MYSNRTESRGKTSDQINMAEAISGPLQTFPLRLHPGQEIYSSLIDFVKCNNLTSAFVLTCVGSVTRAHLRMANAEITKHYEGPFEIVSLVGTLSGGEAGHLHISLSDEQGEVIGGHVMGNLIVHTTAEVVLGNCSGVTFSRADDPVTGYDELVVEKTK